MGGHLLPTMPTGFDAVVDCREVCDWSLIGPVFLHLPMIDGPELPPIWMLSAGLDFVDAVTRTIHTILLHCNMGHNRSGLLTAMYLIDVLGMRPQTAIDLIRSKRGPQALSNQMFVNYLLTLTP
jgi:protein-tyrosine phosphatase